MQQASLREILHDWETTFDWRHAEARLNALSQFMTEIGGLDIHFVHIRPKHPEALRLIMTHGWRSSVFDLLKTVGPLVYSNGRPSNPTFASLQGIGGPISLPRPIIDLLSPSWESDRPGTPEAPTRPLMSWPSSGLGKETTMMHSPLYSRQSWFWLFAPAVGALAGLVYAQMFATEAVSAAVRGAFIGAPILLYERGNLLVRWRETVRKAATPVFVFATIATYILMILVGNATAGTLLHHLLGHMRTAREAMALSESGFAYALFASTLLAFMFRVRDLIGPGLFASLLLGRYHRPTREERIFLFLDVAGSTHFADRHGDLETQAYLGQIFSALSLPVRRSRGSIDDYIGDMALVTWPLHRGARDAACLRCVFDFATLLKQQAPMWQARFGQVPEFRAVLHCGWVVTAEIGLERHKIAYFGDVVNTTGRLESLSKNLNEPVLVSADLLSAVRALPGYLTAENLGFHAMRGRAEPLEVSAIRLRSDQLA